ncbi:MAG: DoxX family protein [Sandaracinaceae bacterium]
MNTVTRFAPPAARILFGLIFFVFGLNGFLNFLPQPEVGAEAGSFLGALAATGYMFPLIKGTEVVAGLMLLSNRFVPLALVLLAPVVVNIVLFHAVLDPAGMVVPLAVLAIELGLAWAYRDSFRGVLRAKTQPAAAASTPVVQPAHA